MSPPDEDKPSIIKDLLSDDVDIAEILKHLDRAIQHQEFVDTAVDVSDSDVENDQNQVDRSANKIKRILDLRKEQPPATASLEGYPNEKERLVLQKVLDAVNTVIDEHDNKGVPTAAHLADLYRSVGTMREELSDQQGSLDTDEFPVWMPSQPSLDELPGYLSQGRAKRAASPSSEVKHSKARTDKIGASMRMLDPDPQNWRASREWDAGAAERNQRYIEERKKASGQVSAKTDEVRVESSGALASAKQGKVWRFS